LKLAANGNLPARDNSQRAIKSLMNSKKMQFTTCTVLLFIVYVLSRKVVSIYC